MISPELLRRYPFFAFLDDTQQKALVMISEEISVEEGTIIFQEGQPANALYLLIEGDVDLYFVPDGGNHHALREPILVGEINPGEPFGLSALIEPYALNATARVARDSRVLKIEASALRALCEVDSRLGYALMRQVARSALERLAFTRIQLAAERV